MMKYARLGAFLVVAAGVVFAGTTLEDAKAGDPPRAYGSSMTGTVATPSTGDTTTTVNFTITLGPISENGSFHDIHLKPPSGKTFPPVVAPSSGTGQIAIDDQSTTDDDQEWDYKANGSGVHIYSDNKAGEGYSGPSSGTQTLSFSLTFQGKPEDLDGVSNIEWHLTSNGKKGFKDKDVLDGDGDDDGLTNGADANDPTVGGVIATLGLNDDDPIAAFINATTPFGAQVGRTFEGQSYAIYTSISLNADFEDAREIGINDTTEPVPSGWLLTVQNSTGVVGSGGSLALDPTFALPNDPSLVGNSFYAVIAILDNGDVVASSTPIEVTIN